MTIVDDKEIGYSLWLLLPAQTRGQIKAIIQRFGRRFGGPIFTPHITLIGNIHLSEPAVIASASSLARAIQPIHVQLSRPSESGQYFHAVFLVAESDQIVVAARQATLAFGLDPRKNFAPHLSVAYGNFSEKHRQCMVAELRDVCPIAFEATELCVYRTSGHVASWRAIAQFSLRSPIPD